MYKLRKKTDETAWLFDVKYNPGWLLAHCLHVRIKETLTLLSGSTRVSKRVTQQGS